MDELVAKVSEVRDRAAEDVTPSRRNAAKTSNADAPVITRARAYGVKCRT